MARSTSLNLMQMHEAAKQLTGTHDYASFCNFRKQMHYEDTIRTVHQITLIEQPNQQITIHISGNNFLYKMVRNLVGTIVYIGTGKISLHELPNIIASKDRTKAGVTAPAHGLTLHTVHYT